MNFSLKNYSCELLNLTGTVGKVELISTFTTAVCESWNVNYKYTWDNAGDLKQLSMDQTLSEDNRSNQETVHSNLSQGIFAIDTWRAVICFLGHGRKHMLKPGFHYAWFPLHGKRHDHDTKTKRL